MTCWRCHEGFSWDGAVPVAPAVSPENTTATLPAAGDEATPVEADPTETPEAGAAPAEETVEDKASLAAPLVAAAAPVTTSDPVVALPNLPAGAGDDEDDDEDKPAGVKKAGRRKINIEFIEDKSCRHITFSKRKAGIMKKAYELSALTGTQVLLLVAAETGHVYTCRRHREAPAPHPEARGQKAHPDLSVSAGLRASPRQRAPGARGGCDEASGVAPGGAGAATGADAPGEGRRQQAPCSVRRGGERWPSWKGRRSSPPATAVARLCRPRRI
jgi:hypothetical protein